MNAASKLDALKERADLLRRLRDFFNTCGFLEVETPLVADEVIPELHIEPLRLTSSQFLQASPELHMKRLLADGAKAIFQVTHSFRAGERGKLHHPEFTMVEWYRVGDDMQAGISLLDELMQSLLQTPPAKRTTYAEAFEQHAGINPHEASIEELAAMEDAPAEMKRTDRDEWLNLILAKSVEPQLGRNRPEIIYHYPASQAALAKTATSPAGHEVAERFELYYRGIELANGYHELCDPAEQRRRFEEVNAARVADGRPALPIPENLLKAMEKGLPDCTGVALGFDRLAMLATGADSIHDVMTFSFCHAMLQ
jgi:lysyl-tRNA synthetase class 2